MPTFLRNIRLTRVDLVDAGANHDPETGDGAHVMLAKRHDYEKQATKREDGVDFPAAAFAFVPDAEAPSTWKLRLWETPIAKETARQVGAAVAALGPGGFRGNRVMIPPSDLPAVKAKVRRAWRRANPDKDAEDMPNVIKSQPSSLLKILAKKFGWTQEETDEAIAELQKEHSDMDDTKKDEGGLQLADLPDDVQAHIKGLEEKLEAAEAATADLTKKVEELEKGPEPEPTEDDVLKAADPAVQEMFAKQQEEIAKLREDHDEAVEKATAEREARLSAEFTKRADDELKYLPGENVAKGQALRFIADLDDEDTRNTLLEMLGAGNKAMADSGHFRELGVEGGADQTGEALEKATALAREKVEKGEYKDLASARAQVWKENKELYEDYQREQAS